MKSRILCALLSSVALIGATAATPTLAQTGGRVILPHPEPAFTGTIGATAATSKGAFAPRPKAPSGAPNVILVMTDDVGFGSVSTFGGPVPKPTLDKLAANGLRYNNFHTTGMCSPSRAALLTGRNAHATGMGALSELATGFPGYTGEISRATATIAETLKHNGYNTAFFGKHHGIPPSEISTTGPFTNWPVGLGFEYFYGFIGSQANQWTPALIQGTVRIDPPKDRHIDEILSDEAIRWIHNQKANTPDKPFFLYMAPGTAHAPLQAPREWVAKFKGKFDQGWDKAREEIFARQKAAGIVPANTLLTPRPDVVPAWDSLTRDQQRVASRLMEVYAAQLAFQDAQFGRIVDELERMGELENTLIIYVEGDNGSSSEGGPHGTTNNTGRLVNLPSEPDSWLLRQLDEMGGPDVQAHYPIGWAWATNAPFPYFKRYASHLGGIRNGLVVSWPEGIRNPGEIRPQFQHLIDIVPTILEAAKLPTPDVVNGVEQRPLDGKSMMATFASADVPAQRKVQYFEILGNHSIYHDGWMASTTPPEAVLATTVGVQEVPDASEYSWELYNLNADYSQSTNLAAKYPQKLQEMQALWKSEGERNQVFPLDNRLTVARGAAEIAARMPPRPTYVYWGTGVELERGVMAPIMTHSFTLTANVTIAPEGGSGVIAAIGDRFAGWSFYMKDGRPIVHHAFSDQDEHHYRLEGNTRVAAGPATIAYEVRYPANSRAADVTIKVNGREIGKTRFPNRANMVVQGESFTLGSDIGAPVTDDYDGDGKFNGTIEKVRIDLPDLAATAAK